MKNKKFEQGEAIVFAPIWAKKTGVDPRHPLKMGQVVYFLCDIPNVPGHCIVVTHEGLSIPMVHPEDFRKAKDEEL